MLRKREEIVEYLRQLQAAGESFPTMRKVAAAVGCNPSNVWRVFRSLEEEGIIYPYKSTSKKVFYTFSTISCPQCNHVFAPWQMLSKLPNARFLPCQMH